MYYIETPRDYISKKYPRDTWYRIADREHKSFPAPKVSKNDSEDKAEIRYGDFIRFDRMIVRCGYYFEPLDAPQDIMIEQASEGVIQDMSSDPKSIVRMNFKAYDKGMKNGTAEGGLDISRSQLRGLFMALGMSEDAALRNRIFRLRQKWVDEQVFPDGSENLRTFWYVDTPGMSCQVSWPRLRVRMVGKRFEGYMDGGYEYPEEYNPPTFSEYSRQALICLGNECFVHPLDLIRNS